MRAGPVIDYVKTGCQGQGNHT